MPYPAVSHSPGTCGLQVGTRGINIDRRRIMMIRFTSRRFASRSDYTYPETRTPRVSRRIELVSARTGPRSGALEGGRGEVRR